MIVKPASTGPLSAVARQRAGEEAERQMAFYLHRAFANSPGIYVLNDLRIEDPDQPAFGDRVAACQIDHLVVHRLGMIIIESKSLRGTVHVRDDGYGGDIWTRSVHGVTEGISSPFQQARRQAEFLRAYLQNRRDILVGKFAPGFRTIAKIVHGTDQRGFRLMPIQIIVAYADSSDLRELKGWLPPSEPFRSYITKADLVVEKVQNEIRDHDRNAANLLTSRGPYGLWSLARGEAGEIAQYLCDQHAPLSTPPSPMLAREVSRAGSERVPSVQAPASRASCKACRGVSLTACWGKYGYYWKCNDCGTNTAMPTVCSACGTEGVRGQQVRIRKEGPKYFRVCDLCGIEERIWTEV